MLSTQANSYVSGGCYSSCLFTHSCFFSSLLSIFLFPAEKLEEKFLFHFYN